MDSTDIPATAAGATRHLLVAVLVAIAYCIYVFAYSNFEAVYQYDIDEGYNTIKALLLDRGFALYSEIWSDQPPLFTYMLWGWFELFGWDLRAGRLLVLFFASLLVFFVYDTTRREAGHGAAVIAVLMLAFSARFERYSVAIMIGMPCVALAVGSFWALARWWRESSPRWLVVCGALLGLSLSIKLITVFLLPIAFAVIAWRGWKTKTRPWLLWGIAGAATLAVGLVPVLLSGEPMSLIDAHATARNEATRYAVKVSVDKLWSFFDDDQVLYVLGCLGVIAAVFRRRVTAWPIAAWFVVAFVLLRGHTPIWNHHRVLLAVPAAVLAGLAVTEMASAFAGEARRWWVASVIAGAAIAVVALSHDRRFPWSSKHGGDGGDLTQALSEAEAVVRAHADHPGGLRFVVASNQLIPFRLGVPTPPSLSVTSDKRFRAEQLSPKQVARIVGNYAPEFVVLTDEWSSAQRKAVRKRLLADYERIHNSRNGRKKVEVFRRRTGFPHYDDADGFGKKLFKKSARGS